MTHPHNPQHEQMSDESMLRNLAAQAEATWPQERPLFERYGLSGPLKILDLGCGPGELSGRLLDLFPAARLVGVDLDQAHLERARARCDDAGGRAEFRVGDALDLDFEPARFDLSVCRHLLQAVPEPRAVLANLHRVTRPGGRLHIVAEDYSMMHFWPTRNDIDEFWHRGPVAYAAALGTDLRSGRKVPVWLRELGLHDVTVDFLRIDTQRVARETFARIWIAWMDGYTDAIAAHSPLGREQVADCFRDMIDCIRNPDGYAVWQLPVISGVV